MRPRTRHGRGGAAGSWWLPAAPGMCGSAVAGWCWWLVGESGVEPVDGVGGGAELAAGVVVGGVVPPLEVGSPGAPGVAQGGGLAVRDDVVDHAVVGEDRYPGADGPEVLLVDPGLPLWGGQRV